MEKSTGSKRFLEDPIQGRVFFREQAGKSFLYFHPKIIDRSIKVLDGSMWSQKETPQEGIVFRAVTCIEAIEWLRDNVGKLSLSKEVYAWMQAASSVYPIDPIPDLPLFDFQLEAVGFLWRRPRAMLSLSPGLGKSLVSITGASILKNVKKILVVAPASLMYMWQSELHKWDELLPYKPVPQIWHGIKNIPPIVQEVESDSKLWIITNPETVVNYQAPFIREKFDLMILDESIYYKSRKSKRTKSMKELGKYIPRVWELTGAPANRMLDDLWAQFNILNPNSYRSYWRFADNYTLVDNSPWAKTVAANKKNAEELIKRRFRDIYFARSQEEVLNIPDWLFTDMDIPMTKIQEKHYKDLEIFLRSEFISEEDQHRIVSVDNHLAKVVRLIQSASNPVLLDGKNSSGKWEALNDLIPLYPAPYIVWTSFIKSAHLLAEQLSKQGLKTAFMIGETKPEDRQSIVDSFQAGKMDALVLGQAVGSFGHTLTAAGTAFYPERNFDGSYFQSLHRVRRIGTTRSPNIVHMRSVHGDGRPTIDALVHSMLDYRVGMIQKLTVGMVLDVIR